MRITEREHRTFFSICPCTSPPIRKITDTLQKEAVESESNRKAKCAFVRRLDFCCCIFKRKIYAYILAHLQSIIILCRQSYALFPVI